MLKIKLTDQEIKDLPLKTQIKNLIESFSEEQLEIIKKNLNQEQFVYMMNIYQTVSQ